MDNENPACRPAEETGDKPKNYEPDPPEESIPVASTIFFGDPRPDFWDENFF